LFEIKFVLFSGVLCFYCYCFSAVVLGKCVLVGIDVFMGIKYFFVWCVVLFGMAIVFRRLFCKSVFFGS